MNQTEIFLDLINKAIGVYIYVGIGLFLACLSMFMSSRKTGFIIPLRYFLSITFLWPAMTAFVLYDRKYRDLMNFENKNYGLGFFTGVVIIVLMSFLGFQFNVL